VAEHRRLNPAGLFDGRMLGFHQIQVSQGNKIIHIAGQAALDGEARPLFPGDFAAQMAHALASLDIALRAAGAARGDVAMLRLYVVDHGSERVAPIVDLLTGFFGADATPPATLVGVSALAMPELLVEIEAVAIT
jgi:enamine deaminase RidA (YjgF/YER057c/UK114 family)